MNIRKQNEETAKVKFLREIDAWLLNTDIPEDNCNVSFTVCECMKCHWTFIGDCERQLHPASTEGTQIPNYCPMCGSKFDDLLE